MRGETYEDPTPCRNGHSPCLRFKSCKECVACRREQHVRRKNGHGEEDRKYHKEYWEDHAEELRKKAWEKYRDHDSVYRVQRILSAARSRAKAQGVPFDLGIDQLPEIPDTCPVLGVPMSIGGSRDFCPSLDKIVPSKGYVPGNIAWVSLRANRIKSDASLDELYQVVRYVEEHTHG